MWKVYKHTNKLNGKVYIGITGQDVERRWRHNGSGYRKCLLFYRAIEKHGWDNFQHDILYDGLTKEEAEILEQKLIEEYKSNDPSAGYNIANGGNANSVSEETKKKISETLKRNYIKENHHNYGKKFSDEFRKKLSDAHKGKISKEEHPNYGNKMSYEQRNKISKTLKEKNIAPSKETRKKGAEARKGQKNSEYWHKRIIEVRSVPVVQMDKNGNIIKVFNSITEASNETGVCGANITAVCKGRRKQASDYKWKYL